MGRAVDALREGGPGSVAGANGSRLAVAVATLVLKEFEPKGGGR